MQFVRNIFMYSFLLSSSVLQISATQYHNIWRSVQENNRDTVIQIFCNKAEYNLLQPYQHPNKTSCCGTGFFIDTDGYIATNAHVVENAVSTWVLLPSLGQLPLEVNIVGICPERDLALLQLTQESKTIIKNAIGAIPFLTMGDSDLVQRADEVMALGYPLGESALKSTTGVISGWQNKYIQISAPINPGNSGGPLLGLDGKVVGINTCVAVGLTVQNVGYIVPINEFKLIISELKKFSLLKKPFMGCLYHNSTPELAEYLGNPSPAGCFVASVIEQSPLCKAGIEQGDMIYAIDGYTVDMFGDMNVDWTHDKVSLVDYVRRLKIGQEVTVVLYRNGEQLEKTITFNHVQDPPIRDVHPHHETIDYEVFGGLVVMELTVNHIQEFWNQAPDLRQYIKFDNRKQSVLLITHVFPEAYIFRTRVLQAGAIIKEINNVPVTTLKEFRNAILQGNKLGYFVVKTKDTSGGAGNDFLAVTSFKQALEDTISLSKCYGYHVSESIKELLQ